MPEFNNVNLFLPEIKELLRTGKYRELKTCLKEVHAMDIAACITDLTSHERIIAFKLLVPHKATEVFESLGFEEQSFLLNNLDNTEVSSVLDEMAPDERARLFKDLSQKNVKKLFLLMKKEEVDDVRHLLKYEEESAGSLMTTEFVELKKDWTARQALLSMQESQRAAKVETIYSVYVTDEDRKLIGRIGLQDLIITAPNTYIKDIMSPVQFLKVNVSMDQEQVAKIFAQYDLLAAPVVDDENNLIGIITIDDIVDVIHQEANEDMAMMAGTDDSELVNKSIFKNVKVRLPWLFASWFGGLFTMSLIGFYEGTLSQVIALASFMPVILGMSGNVGTQSSTIVVRGLATGYIDVKQLWKMVFNQIRVGLVLGITYGVLLGLVAHFMYGSEIKYGLIGLVVGLGICCSMTFTATIGTLLPMLFIRIGVDPAVATGPFISTAGDIIGVLVYFTLATVLLL